MKNMLLKKVKFGFTLAEVLITLGIIGVVAAMTIPTLIANTRSQQYRSRFKKTVSTLSQAARMSQAQYGFDYAGLTKACGSDGASEKPDSTQTICALLNGTLTGATYFAKASDIPIPQSQKNKGYNIYSPYINQFSTHDLANAHAYVLQDGTIVAFHQGMGLYPCELAIGSTLKDTYVADGTTTTLSNCYGFIDVNGTNLPNKEVSCSAGTNSLSASDCVVKNDAVHMTDIFPIRFHDGIVEPTTAAGRYILRTAK